MDATIVDKIEMYYIQDTRSYLGNAVVWWGIDGRGYTAKINEAGKYTREQALDICKHDTDKAWLCSYIDNHEKAHVTIIDAQYLDRKQIETFKQSNKLL